MPSSFPLILRSLTGGLRSSIFTDPSDLLKRWAVLVCFSQLHLIFLWVVMYSGGELWHPLFLPNAAQAGSFVITVERSRQSEGRLQLQHMPSYKCKCLVASPPPTLHPIKWCETLRRMCCVSNIVQRFCGTLVDALDTSAALWSSLLDTWNLNPSRALVCGAAGVLYLKCLCNTNANLEMCLSHWIELSINSDIYFICVVQEHIIL